MDFFCKAREHTAVSSTEVHSQPGYTWRPQQPSFFAELLFFQTDHTSPQTSLIDSLAGCTQCFDESILFTSIRVAKRGHDQIRFVCHAVE